MLRDNKNVLGTLKLFTYKSHLNVFRILYYSSNSEILSKNVCST